MVASRWVVGWACAWACWTSSVGCRQRPQPNHDHVEAAASSAPVSVEPPAAIEPPPTPLPAAAADFGKRVANSTSPATSLLVHDADVVWVTAASGDVFVATTEKPARSLVAGRKDGWNGAVAAGSDGFYWLELAQQPNEPIRRIGVIHHADWRGHGSKVVAREAGWLGPLVVAGDRLFLHGQGRIDVVDTRGCRANKKDDCATRKPFVDGNVVAMTTDGEFVYWLARDTLDGNGNGAHVMRLATTGGTPSVVADAKAGAIATRLVADPTHVYWLERPDLDSEHDVIRSAPKGGGPARTLFAAPHAVSLAVSEKALYWGTLWDGQAAIYESAKDGARTRVLGRVSNSLELTWSAGRLTWSGFDGIYQAPAP